MPCIYKHYKYPAPTPQHLFLAQISLYKFLKTVHFLLPTHDHDLLADLTLSVSQQRMGNSSPDNQQTTKRRQQPTYRWL